MQKLTVKKVFFFAFPDVSVLAVYKQRKNLTPKALKERTRKTRSLKTKLPEMFVLVRPVHAYDTETSEKILRRISLG